MPQTKKSGSLRGKLILLATTCGFCLGALEWATRVFVPIMTPTARTLLWNTPHFAMTDAGAIHYRPRETVRETAIYDASIEYDVVYRTNNLGLIDSEDYPPRPIAPRNFLHVAFLGDSFTVGSGARPWVPRFRTELQRSLPDAYVYNLGLSGASILQLEKNLRHFSSILSFDIVFLIVISNDFRRILWRPLTRSDEVRFCPASEPEPVCFRRSPIGIVVPANIRRDGLIRYLSQRSKREVAGDGHRFVRTVSFHILSLISQLAQGEPLFALGEKEQRVNPIVLNFVEQQNVEALRRLSRQFPQTRIHVIHLPEKQEVRSGRYSKELFPEVQKIGFSYFPALSRCRWALSDFHPRDPHPNERGYQTLVECIRPYVSRVLRSMSRVHSAPQVTQTH